jgi:hypothetical protein
VNWNGDNVIRRAAQAGVVLIVMAAGLAVSPAVAGASQSSSSANPSSVIAPVQTVKMKKSPRYSSHRSCELNRRDYMRYYNTTSCYWYKDGYYFFYQNK